MSESHREAADCGQGGNRRDTQHLIFLDSPIFKQVFQGLWASVPLKTIPRLEGTGTITDVPLAANGCRQEKRCTNTCVLCLSDESFQAEAAFLLSACAAPGIAEDMFLGYTDTVMDP